MAPLQVAVESDHGAADGACKGCIWRERWQKASMTAASGLSANGSIGFQMWLLQKKHNEHSSGGNYLKVVGHIFCILYVVIFMEARLNRRYCFTVFKALSVANLHETCYKGRFK